MGGDDSNQKGRGDVENRQEEKHKVSVAFFAAMGVCMLLGCSRGERDKPGQSESDPGQTKALQSSAGMAPDVADKDKPITCLADLKGKKIASLTGTSFDVSINRVIPGVTHMYFNDSSAMVQAVLAGKVSAWAADAPVARLVAAQFPDLSILPELICVDHYGLAVRKGHPLGRQASEVIERFKKDGTMKAMEDKWFGADPAVKAIPDLSGKDGFDGRAGVIRFGHDTVTEPMSYVGDKGASLGLDVELAVRIAHALNMKIELVPMNFGGLIAALQSDKVDMVAGCMTITEERKKSVDFTVSYHSGGQALLVKKAPTGAAGQGLTDLSKLATGRVGVMTGSVAEFYMEEKYPHATIGSYDNIADAVTALQGNKLDYVITAYTTALNFVKNNRDLTFIPDKLMNEGPAIAVAKGNETLLRQLDETLARFRKDGTLAQIISRWIKEGGEAYDSVERPRAADGKVLRVAIAANREPMCFMRNNAFAGLDCELIERLAYELGLRVEYSDMQYSALVLALQSGRVDVIVSNMTPTPERKEKVNFTARYFDNPQVAMVRKPAVAKKITDVSQLAGKKVGILTGSAYDGMLKKHIPGAVPEYFNAFSDQTAALKAGKISGFLVDEPIARDIINKTAGVTFLKKPLSSDGYAFAFSKNQTALRGQVNALLKEMRANGEIAKIDAKWFGKDEAAKILPGRNPEGKNGVLRFATNSNLAPFAYVKDGKIVGYDIEIAEAVAGKLGRRLEIVNLDFAAIIPSLVAGKSDMAGCCITVTRERAKSVLFSDPDYTGGVVVMVGEGEGTRETAGGSRFWRDLAASFRRTFVTEDRYKLVWQGIQVTLLISALSAVFGTVLGFGVCMMRRAKSAWLYIPAKVFIRAIQGTPIVVLLMILYYVIFGGVDIDAVFVAVIGFSINFAAYVSEMMRTGIDAVDKGQHEAAVALGFNKVEVFTKITFPQAARQVLPVFKGEFISMLKATSIVGYIAIQDLTKMSDIIRSRTYEAFFPLIATALIYFAIAYVMMILLSLVEVKVDPKRRARVVKGVARS